MNRIECYAMHGNVSDNWFDIGGKHNSKKISG